MQMLHLILLLKQGSQLSLKKTLDATKEMIIISFSKNLRLSKKSFEPVKSDPVQFPNSKFSAFYK